MLSVDIVDVVIGLVAHCGDARLVGDVIECDELPGGENVILNSINPYLRNSFQK